MGDTAEHRDVPLTEIDVKALRAELDGRKAE